MDHGPPSSIEAGLSQSHEPSHGTSTGSGFASFSHLGLSVPGGMVSFLIAFGRFGIASKGREKASIHAPHGRRPEGLELGTKWIHQAKYWVRKGT